MPREGVQAWRKPSRAALAAAVLLLAGALVYSAPIASAQEGVTTVAQWITSDWGTCSRPCGGGTQNRTIDCWQASNGQRVSTHLCPAKQPLPVRECNNFACPVRQERFFSCNTGSTCPLEHKQGGRLTMFIEEARNLPDLDGWGIAGGETDTYVEVELTRPSLTEFGVIDSIAKRTTDFVRNSNNPVWPGEGERLEFGVQESATQITFTLWDSDTGFEGSDEQIATTSAKVIACSPFMFEACTESAWLSLDAEDPCWYVSLDEATNIGYWNFSSTAPCLKVRMDIEPLQVLPVAMYSSAAQDFGTTIAEEFSGSDNAQKANVGWGVPYAFDTQPIIGGYEKFEPARGGTIIKTDRTLNQGLTGATEDFYAQVSINLDVTMFVFRRKADTFADTRPAWLRSWSESKVELKIEGEEGFYLADVKDFDGPTIVTLGDPVEGISEEAVSLDPMYIPVARLRPTFDIVEPTYPKTFDRDRFVPQMFQFVIPLMLLVTFLWAFLRRIRFRLDLVPTFLTSMQLPEVKSAAVQKINAELGVKPVHIKYTSQVASLFVSHLDESLEYYDNNREFRRNLYFASRAVQIVAVSPLVVFFAWGITAASTVTPASVGYGILFIGSACCMTIAGLYLWQLEGWRMLPTSAWAFALSFASVFLFQLFSIFDDVAPLSLYSLTGVFLTLNMMPMSWIVFTNDKKLRRSFAQLSAKSQEYAFMMETAKYKHFASMVGAQFSINPNQTGGRFKYTDTVYRMFTVDDAVQDRRTRKAYTLAWAFLLVLAIVSWSSLDDFTNQGVATLISVTVLDSVVYLLHRSRMTLTPGFLCAMMFVARGFIVAFVGEFWLAGHGLAFFTFGVVLGMEIVGRRLPVMTRSSAGAVAYFGWEDEGSGPSDIAGSPEFSLGYISFLFLLLLIGSVFAFPDNEIPSLDVGGTDVPVWVFGVAAFLLVLVSCCTSATMRAFSLEKRGILKTKAYLMHPSFTLPYMLACLTELLLVCSGLLMFAITGSSLILELVVFLPFIMVFGTRLYSQWHKNDYQLLEPAENRLTEKDRMLLEIQAAEEEAEASDEESGSEDDVERDPSKVAAADDVKAGNVIAGGEGTPGRGGSAAAAGAGLDMGSKNHIALPPLQRTSEPDSGAAALATMPSQPILPMSPLVTGAAAAKSTPGKDGDVGAGETKGSDESGGDGGGGAGDGAAKALTPEEEAKLELEKKKAARKSGRKRNLGCWARQKAKYNAWHHRESDPTKMTDLGACLRCRLTRVDVVTLLSLFGLLASIFVMGNVVAAVETPSWLGHALWLGLFTVFLTVAPVIKYFNTYVWSGDMLLCAFTGWALFTGALFGMWAEVMGADINNDLTLWLFSVLIMYPTVILVASGMYMWRDEGWDARAYVRVGVPIGLFLTFFWNVLMYVFATPYWGFSITVLWLAFISVIVLINIWVKEGYYLPPFYASMINVVMFTLSVIAILVGLFADVNFFYCISVAFVFVAVRHLGRAISHGLNRPPDSPVFYSQFIFPIYSYDPDTHNIVSENHWGRDVGTGMAVLLLWGVFATIFENPVGVGISITSIVLITLVVIFGYTCTDALYRLGTAARFMDEAMMRHAAEEAKHTFDDRRVPFKILCNEFESLDRREAALEAQLARYGGGDTKAAIFAGKEVRARNTASEVAAIIHDIHWHLQYRPKSAKEREAAEAKAAEAARVEAALRANRQGSGKGGKVAPVEGKGDAAAAVQRSKAKKSAVARAIEKRRLKEATKTFVRRPDALYNFGDVLSEVWFLGSGPLGPFCCSALPYRVYKLYCKPRKSAAQKYKEQMDEAAREEAGESGGEKAQDSAAMLRGLWVQEAHLAIEYYEEMRTAAHFMVLLLVAAEAKIRTESVLFQKFLREYRFKLMANGVHPPEDIFRTQSYATVDVHLVATWMQSLTPEQRERFRQLKERFTLEVNEQYKQRLIHDAEEEEAALALREERRPREHEMYQKRLMEFQTRRINRRKEARDTHMEDESAINEREFLDEVDSKNYYCQPGMYGREHQFHDPEFPHTYESVGPAQRAEMVKGWRVASGFNINAGLFHGGTDPDDVYQGQLADGWLLSAISIVAASGGVDDGKVDELVARLFVKGGVVPDRRSDAGSGSDDDEGNAETSLTGVYGVRLYKNAQWETVWVDDFFPHLDNKFKVTRCAGAAFAYSNDFKELWVPLIEKACAKYYGTYASLERGYVHHALEDLTGGASEEIFLAEASRGASKLRLWNKLITYKKNGFLLGAGTVLPASSDRELMDSGLVFGAAYVIYDVRHIDGLRLLKLRNPPGDHGEWQGDWGDDSPLWTKRLKAKLDFTNDADDGTFWMSFDDWCLAFRSLYVCKYYSDDLWHSASKAGFWKGICAAGLPNKHNPVCQVWNNPQFELFVERPTDVNVRLSQSYPNIVLHTAPHPVAVYFVAQGDGTRGQLSHHGLADPSLDDGNNVMDPIDDMLGRGRETGHAADDAIAPKAERVRRLTNTNVVAHSGQPVREREITFSVTQLKPDRYTILVAAYQARMEGPFTLTVHTNHEVKLRQIWPPGQDDADSDDEGKKGVKARLAAKVDKAKEKAREKAKGQLQKTETEVDVLDDAEADAAAAMEAMDDAKTYMDKARAANEVQQHSAWIENHDPTSGRTYYYNMQTGESQWEVPDELKTSGLQEGLKQDKVTYGEKNVKKTVKNKGPKCSICQHHKHKGIKEDTHKLWQRDGHKTSDLLECAGGCGAVVHPLCAGYTDDRPPPDSWTCPLCQDDEDDY